MSVLYFVMVGLIVGAVLASTGVIGPFLIPALLFFGLSSSVARGTTLVSELLMTLICVIGHKRKRNIDKRVTLALLPGAVFVILGAHISIQVPELPMNLALGIVEMVIGITVMGTTVNSADNHTSEDTIKTKTAMAKFMIAAAFAGTAKGFFGMGWGPISVGSLLLLGVKARIAVGSTLVIRLLLDCLGGISYASMNLVDINVAITLTLAGAVTAIPAVRLTTKTEEKKFRVVLGSMIILLGALVIVKALISIP